MNGAEDTGAAVLNTLSSFEVGYKGIIGDKLSLAVDFYTYERQGFTQFTAIGPTYGFLPDTRPAGTGDFANALAGAIANEIGPAVATAVGGPTSPVFQPTLMQLAGLAGSVVQEHKGYYQQKL